MKFSMPIVFNTSAAYVNITYITMCSILNKGCSDFVYVFYVFISEDVDESQKDLLTSLEKDFINTKVFIKTIFDKIFSDKRMINGRIPNIAYARLFACDFILENKCLYLDQDIYIHGDISELYTIDIKNVFVAGVPDLSLTSDMIVKRFEKISSDYSVTKYVNAGVLLMNLKKMREEGWCKRVQNLIPLCFPLGDQDVLNFAARDKILYLPERYNLIREGFSNTPKNGLYIIHYAGPNKPWNCVTFKFAHKWWLDCMKTKVFPSYLSNDVSIAFFNSYMNAAPLSLTDMLRLSWKKTCYVFGAGKFGAIAIRQFFDIGLCVDGVLVTNVANEKSSDLCGIPIQSFLEIEDKKNSFVYVSVYKDGLKIVKMLYMAGFRNVYNIGPYLANIAFVGKSNVLKPALSVIVPVYNAEYYLKKCVNSILSQTYANLELILIDDGSLDSSGELCDKFAAADNRVTVIHQENAGQQKAQTRGIEVAKGERIAFVDADDWIEPCMYEKLLSEMGNADLITSGIQCESEDRKLISLTVDNFAPGKYESESDLKYFFDNLILYDKSTPRSVLGGLSNNKVDKIFKTDIVRKIYKNVNIGIRIEEDYLFTMIYALYCKSIIVTHAIYYHYVKNQNSVTAGLDANFVGDREKIFHAISSALKGHNYEKSLRYQLEKRSSYFFYKNYSSFVGLSEKKFFYNYDFPDYRIIAGKKLVLFGAGTVGKSYNYWIKSRNASDIVLWIDNKIPSENQLGIQFPSTIMGTDFDIVVIAVLNEQIAQDIMKQLLELGCDTKKILWKRPMDVLWGVCCK